MIIEMDKGSTFVIFAKGDGGYKDEEGEWREKVPMREGWSSRRTRNWFWSLAALLHRLAWSPGLSVRIPSGGYPGE